MKNQFSWRFVLRMGLFAGIVVLYSAAVGMLETFNEREVIEDLVTMGYLLLFLPVFVAAYFVGRRASKSENPLIVIASGALVGVVATIPIIILIFLADPLDMRRIFVNVSPRMIRAATFDADELINGVLILLGVEVILGTIAAGLHLLPLIIRRALITGAGVTIAVGVMGELITLVLRQLIERDIISNFFARDVLRQNTAIGIFIITVGISLFWAWRGDVVQSQIAGMSEGQRRTAKISGFSILGIILLILPWVLGSFLSQVTNNIGLYVMMALGLNVAIGLAGLLDLGYVTNFAVGAYVMGLLTSTGPLGAGPDFMVFWLVIPIALISAMITGFLFAVPVLKMRGDYLAIATLGFGEIIGTLALSDWLKPAIGGAQGILFIPKPQLFDITLKDPQQIYYLILAACVFMLYISVRLNNSRIGRQWMSVREDEDVAAAMGIDVARSKLLAFTISAASGGLAGGIFATQVGSVFPNSFVVLVSINVLSIIIVGGMGSIPGIILGSLVLVGLPELLREFAEYRYLLYGALLVVIMIARPEGLWPSAVRRRELHSDDELPPAKAEPTPEPPVISTGDERMNPA